MLQDTKVPKKMTHQTFDKLRFRDTNAQKTIDTAALFTFLDTGRDELTLLEHTLLDQGCDFVVASVDLTCKTPLNWPGKVEIMTNIVRIGKSSITFHQALLQNHVSCAEAVSTLVQIDQKTRKPRPLTPASKMRLSDYLHKDHDILGEKKSRPENNRTRSLALFPHQTYDKIRFEDTDALGHVNNATFSTFFETGRISLLQSEENSSDVVSQTRLNFIEEINWPGNVEIGTGVTHIDENTYTVYQAVFQDGICVADSETLMVRLDKQTHLPQPLTDVDKAHLREYWLE